MWENGDKELLKKVNGVYKNSVNGGIKIGIFVGIITMVIIIPLLFIFVKDKDIIKTIIAIGFCYFLCVGFIGSISSKKFIEVRYQKVVITSLITPDEYNIYRYSFKDEEGNIKEAEALINNKECEGKLGYLMECKTKKKSYTYIALEEDLF